MFWTPCQRLSARAQVHSVGSYSLQLHSYRILVPQLSAHLHSIKHFSEKLHVLQSAVIFKNLDTLRSCFSVQALCFCVVFLDHVKYLQIHATSATSTLADWHTQKIHACSEVGGRTTAAASHAIATAARRAGRQPASQRICSRQAASAVTGTLPHLPVRGDPIASFKLVRYQHPLELHGFRQHYPSAPVQAEDRHARAREHNEGAAPVARGCHQARANCSLAG